MERKPSAAPGDPKHPAGGGARTRPAPLPPLSRRILPQPSESSSSPFPPAERSVCGARRLLRASTIACSSSFR